MSSNQAITNNLIQAYAVLEDVNASLDSKRDMLKVIEQIQSHPMYSKDMEPERKTVYTKEPKKHDISVTLLTICALLIMLAMGIIILRSIL